MTPYLVENPPARSQWRSRPLEGIDSVVCLHTAEGSHDGSLNWMRTRTTAGSYHMLGRPGRITPVVDLAHAAYHCRGLNTRSFGISCAMYATDWPSAGGDSITNAWVDCFAEMANRVAQWCLLNGLEAPEPVRLTRAEALRRGASGFVSHGDMDPGRRSDPGSGFPWGEFLGAYEVLTGQSGPQRKDKMEYPYLEQVKEAQRLLGVEPDGWFGDKSLEALRRLSRQSEARGQMVDELSFKVAGLEGVNEADAELGREFRALIGKTRA